MIGHANLEQDRVTALKLLLDEMYAGLKEYFETLGWEVLTAQEASLKGARDKDIVEYARNHDLLLVTQGHKPAYLVFVYFVNDAEMAGPSSISEWKGAIELVHTYLGITRHKLQKYTADVFIDVTQF